MDAAIFGVEIMDHKHTTDLPQARRRPAVSHLLQELDLQLHDSERRLEVGVKMEMTFSLSMELNNLFRAGLRSRGFAGPEIDHLFNSGRR